MLDEIMKELDRRFARILDTVDNSSPGTMERLQKYFNEFTDKINDDAQICWVIKDSKH